MTTTALPSQLDRFIPIAKAAHRLKLSERSLRQMITAGTVKGAMLPSGEIGVSELDLDQIITREQFAHLRGIPLTTNQAADRYRLSHWSIRNWIDRGYIKVLKPGYGMEIDEADVAYCAAVYQSRGGARGKRLFDDDGKPYQPKHTEWADYQRERRKKKKNGSHTV